jgi:hypothetical protein
MRDDNESMLRMLIYKFRLLFMIILSLDLELMLIATQIGLILIYIVSVMYILIC